MITEIRGNLLRSDARILTNAVNCVGVMGKGIALQFRREYPEMYRDYVERCRRGEVRVGEPYLYGRILNFPTKGHWMPPSELAWIAEGLSWIDIHSDLIGSIAIPPLGCGNGGLKWSDVRRLIYDILEYADVDVMLYVP